MTITIKDPTTIITVDGPVGVGKSSVAKEVAKRLNYYHLDTGATYRVVTYEAMRRNIPLSDEKLLTKLAESLEIELNYDEGKLTVYCNSEDVSDAIRDPAVSKNTSPVADCIGVRRAMGQFQRKLGVEGHIVSEGRDIGTVIFPEAKWKFYLDAKLEERAKRRFLQLQQWGKTPSLEQEINSIITRDKRDRSRPYGPLRIPKDAAIIDTTLYSLEQVVDIIISIVGSEKK